MSALDYTHKNFIGKFETVFSLFSDVKTIINQSDLLSSQQVIENIVDIACSEIESSFFNTISPPFKSRFSSIYNMTIGIHSIVQNDINPKLYQSSILPIIDEIMFNINTIRTDLSVEN